MHDPPVSSYEAETFISVRATPEKRQRIKSLLKERGMTMQGLIGACLTQFEQACAEQETVRSPINVAITLYPKEN